MLGLLSCTTSSLVKDGKVGWMFKDKTLDASRAKQPITYKGASIRLIADNLRHQRPEGITTTYWKWRLLRITYLTNTFFKNKILLDKQKLRWTETTIPSELLSMELLSGLAEMGNSLYAQGWAAFWDFGENPWTEKWVELGACQACFCSPGCAEKQIATEDAAWNMPILCHPLTPEESQIS